MKIIISIVVVLLFGGCSGGINTTPIWVGQQRVPLNYPTPQGFKITPHEAELQVWNARRLSLKHIWHIYSDGSDYHIVDSFLGSNTKQAKGGVIVDGQTGRIKN